MNDERAIWEQRLADALGALAAERAIYAETEAIYKRTKRLLSLYPNSPHAARWREQHETADAALWGWQTDIEASETRIECARRALEKLEQVS